MARKTGEYSGSGKNRKQWNGKRWVSRPVAVAPKPSTRSGQGGRGGNTTRRGSTTSKSSYIPADKRPADMRKGKIYGDTTAATGRNWTNGHGQVSSKPSTGNHKSAVAPPAPKLPPKPSTKVSSPKKPAATSSKKMTPWQQWAKAHPELAKKVKKGQSGYKELQIGRSKPKPDSSQIRAMSK